MNEKNKSRQFAPPPIAAYFLLVPALILLFGCLWLAAGAARRSAEIDRRQVVVAQLKNLEDTLDRIERGSTMIPHGPAALDEWRKLYAEYRGQVKQLEGKDRVIQEVMDSLLGVYANVLNSEKQRVKILKSVWGEKELATAEAEFRAQIKLAIADLRQAISKVESAGPPGSALPAALLAVGAALVVALLALLLIYYARQWNARVLAERKVGNASVSARHADMRVEAMTRISPLAMLTLDGHGVIQSFNPKAEQVFGTSAADVIGQNLTKILPGASRRQLEQYLSVPEKADAGIGMEIAGKRKDGKELRLDVLLTRVGFDDSSVTFGIIRDASAAGQADSGLEKKLDFVSAVLDNSPALTLVLDRAGKILHTNQTWERISGFPGQESQGRELWEVAACPAERDLLKKAVDKVSQGQQQVAAGWVGKDGRKRRMAWSFAGLAGDDNALQCIIATGLDVTALEAEPTDSAASTAVQMEAMQKLVGPMALNFSNLLTTITGYSDLLLYSIEDGNPLRKDVEEIRNAGDRAISVVHQLLAFGRRQMFQPTLVDLNSLVTESLRSAQALLGDSVKVQAALEPALGPIKADSRQIERVLINLAVNARDAMPEGGRLSVKTSNVFIDKAHAHHLEPGPYALLEVADSGTGMDDDTCARIFEPFFTTKEAGRGMGLGLAAVYGIVIQSGGDISVTSQPGAGTHFAIYLPRAEQQQTGGGAPASRGMVARQS